MAAERDVVLGQPAAEDDLFGQNGADVIDGGGDDDSLFGGSNEDTLCGGAGDDTVFGEDAETKAAQQM